MTRRLRLRRCKVVIVNAAFSSALESLLVQLREPGQLDFQKRDKARSARRRPDVASERQIAANCRNAHKSTGPRSGAGKKRASRNAYRHGLSLSITSTATFAKQLDILVRKIAGDGDDAFLRERARAVARAELDL